MWNTYTLKTTKHAWEISKTKLKTEMHLADGPDDLILLSVLLKWPTIHLMWSQPKSQHAFSVEINKVVLQFIWKGPGEWTKSEGYTDWLRDFLQSLATDTVWYYHKGKHIRAIEWSPEIEPRMCEQLLFDKSAKAIQQRKDVSSARHWNDWISVCKNELGFILCTIYKILAQNGLKIASKT